MIVSMVLATDLNKHFKQLGKFRSRLQSLEGIQLADEDDKFLILTILLKASDVSHTAKPEILH